MNILITGGAGFIGSHMADKLIAEGHRVFVYDNLDPQVHKGYQGWPDYLHNDCIKILADIRNYDELKNVILHKNIEAIYHFASMVGVGQSMLQIKKYMDVAVGGTANIYDILANNSHQVKKVIVASSMSAYGEGSYISNSVRQTINNGLKRTLEQCKNKEWDFPNLRPISTSEDKIFESNSIYALAKKMQEEMSLSFAEAYNVPVVALRFFNIYGSRQSLNNPYTGVAAIFCGCYLSGQAPTIFEDGNQMRDFVHIDDIIQACYLSLIKKEANYQVFNVGSGYPISIKEIAKTIKEEMKSDLSPIISNTYRVGDIRNCYADISKIQNALGYAPKFTFDEGVKELVEWVKHEKSSINVEEMKETLSKKNLIV